MKFTLSKENTFCIALDARWPAMQERLKDIPCTRWKACLPEEVTEHCAPHMNRFVQACAQSHVTLWREILKRNLEYAFIMEDDVLFANDWREKLEAWHEVEDPDWDLVLLNASEAMSPEETWLPCTNQCLTGAYIVSRKGARSMLDMFPQTWESDAMTWCLQERGHSYAYFPWPVIQEGKDTTIGSNVKEDQEKVRALLGDRISNYQRNEFFESSVKEVSRPSLLQSGLQF